jgi:uncharacterized RDD family membrane protein YckC
MAEECRVIEKGDGSVEANRCAECYTVYSVDEMIRHGNIFICANCKPRFVQKLAEGASVPGIVRYAGFWRRLLASLLDGLLLGIVNFIVQLAILLPAFSVAVTEDPANFGLNLGLVIALYVIQIGTGFTYETVLLWKYGSTLGKMACQVEVVTAEGKPITYLRSVGRYFAKLLSWFTLGIGFIIAAFDQEKRSIHDRICNTRVILK